MLVAILFLGFILYVALAGWRGRMLAPVTLYTSWLWLYPLATGILLSDAGTLPPVVQPFSPDEVNEFLLLSLASLLGLVTADLLVEDKFHVLARIAQDSAQSAWRADVFSVFSLILSAGFAGFIFVNREIFLNNYIYQLLRADAGDARISVAINISSSLEILFIISVFCRLVVYRALGGYAFVAVLFYLCLKILVGSRLMVVPLALGLVYMLNPGRILGRRLGAVIGVLGGIAFFILVNFLRRDDVAISDALVDAVSEFLFAVISAMHSVSIVAQGAAPDGLALLFDGIIGVVPSALLGGDKTSWLAFEKWKDSIGGAAFLSPVGGYYLPGQIYLIFKLKLLCYLFFLGFGCLIKKCTARLSRIGERRKLSMLIPLQIATFGTVFAVRTEFWVLEKMFIQQFVFLSLLVVATFAIWTRLRTYS